MWETIAESECSCVTGRHVTDNDIDILAKTAAEYRTRTAQVAQQWVNKKLSNFTVAYQPFTGDVLITNGVCIVRERVCTLIDWLIDWLIGVFD
jgi:hypothetical protein